MGVIQRELDLQVPPNLEARVREETPTTSYLVM